MFGANTVVWNDVWLCSWLALIAKAASTWIFVSHTVVLEALVNYFTAL